MNISCAILSVSACFWWNGGLQNTALQTNGSTPESALLIINSQRSNALPAGSFLHSNGWNLYRHRRFIDKYHARLRRFSPVSGQSPHCRSRDRRNLPVEVFRQMLHKEARADIQSGTRKHIRMVVNRPACIFPVSSLAFAARRPVAMTEGS